MEGSAFDALFRVDTGGVIPPTRLAVAGSDAVSYEGTSPLGFLRLLRRLPVEPASCTFVDLGCGKGRTLVLAAHQRFRRLVGVEIAPDLLAVAQRNLTSVLGRPSDLVHSAQLVEADVAHYTFSVDEPTVLYMYNPFGRQTMRAVANNIDAAVRATSQPFFVAYYIPRYSDEIDRLASLRCVYRDRRRAIYRSA